MDHLLLPLSAKINICAKIKPTQHFPRKNAMEMEAIEMVISHLLVDI